MNVQVAGKMRVIACLHVLYLSAVEVNVMYKVLYKPLGFTLLCIALLNVHLNGRPTDR